ncbi:MAG TPA: hypothetical protein DCR14_04915 [Acidimicrobiaceae bacterium]|nr:hypothetical protein [Acidimicrobiaceae bacterium]
MKISRSKRRKVMSAGFVAVVVTAGAAFAATNTVSDRNAGMGTSVVSGFTVHSMGYHAGSNPLYVGRVTFDISRDVNPQVVDSTNASVFISLDDSETYFPCDVSVGSASCVITEPIQFADVETADIVAYDLQNSPG